MAEDVNDLIDSLRYWQAHDGMQSPRELAIAKLKKRGRQVVPVLIEQLESLLAYRDRVGTIRAEWDSWYERADKLREEHGGVPDIAEYRRALGGDDLPDPAEIDNNPDPAGELRAGIIEALHRIGDQRASAVITASLADDACVWAAARALRDIPGEAPVGPLLDALVRVEPIGNDSLITDIIDTLQSYDVSGAVVAERYQAEDSPRGRANLMELLDALAQRGDSEAAALLETIDEDPMALLIEEQLRRFDAPDTAIGEPFPVAPRRFGWKRWLPRRWR